MGPCIPFLVSPETDDVGEACCGAFDLKGVIDWDTPDAKVNCSLNSTLVRPFAVIWDGELGWVPKIEKRLTIRKK